MIKEELADVFAQIEDREEMLAFFDEIFTSKEVDDLSRRWQIFKELMDGESQRNIASRHHISLCKITRGSKVLKSENCIVRDILTKLKTR